MDAQQAIDDYIASLPVVKLSDILADDFCPICLCLFRECEAEGSGCDSFGITKLEACGHLFCRKDLVEWITTQHGSCPTCRHAFLDIRPHSDSDDESSDGGEYIPYDDEDDEEAFLDIDQLTSEPSDIDMTEEPSIELPENWNDWDLEDAGLTDGESATDGDVSLSEVSVSQEDCDVEVVEGCSETSEDGSDTEPK